MSPLNNPRKSVTPDSVKVLMMVEAGIIGFLSYWVFNEYTYNVYFRLYADQVILNHVTLYTIVLGLGIGLTGSIITAMFYKNLQHARHQLETVAVPKIRGAVERVLSNIPAPDGHQVSGGATEQTTLRSETSSESQEVGTTIPVTRVRETEEEES